MDIDWLVKVASIAGGFATAVAAVLATAAAAFAYLQVKAMAKARQLESILTVLRQFDDEQFRRTRWFIYENSEQLGSLLSKATFLDDRKWIDREIQKLSKGAVDLVKIEAAFNALNNVAFLFNHQYAPPELLTDMMKSTFSRFYSCFLPYIEARRASVLHLEHPEQGFAYDFEKLVCAFDKRRLTLRSS